MIDPALISILLADDDVTDLVGNRVQPATASRVVDGQLPKIVFSQVSSRRPYCDDGYAGLTQTDFQFDIFAERMSEARAVEVALVAALDEYRGTASGTRIERIYFTNSRFQPGQLADGQNQSIARVAAEATIVFRE